MVAEATAAGVAEAPTVAVSAAVEVSTVAVVVVPAVAAVIAEAVPTEADSPAAAVAAAWVVAPMEACVEDPQRVLAHRARGLPTVTVVRGMRRRAFTPSVAARVVDQQVQPEDREQV
jgi:hypothetical protein